VTSFGAAAARAGVAGAVAGVGGTLLTAPLKRVVTVMQTHSNHLPLREILRKGGMRGMWRGAGVEILMAGPRKVHCLSSRVKTMQHVQGLS
jgi:hypothetical protein